MSLNMQSDEPKPDSRSQRPRSEQDLSFGGFQTRPFEKSQDYTHVFVENFNQFHLKSEAAASSWPLWFSFFNGTAS